MSTVAETVRDALLILKVADAKQPIKPVDMADGIRALNQMMRRWEADGLAMGWVDVSNPSDTLPVPAEAEQAVSLNLAMNLRPRYGVTLEQDVMAMAMAGLSSLAVDVASSTFNRITYPDLPAGEAQGVAGGWPAGLYG